MTEIFTGISAVLGKGDGRWICIVGHTIQDVRDVWDCIREDSQSVEPLDESIMQEVIIGAKANLRHV